MTESRAEWRTEWMKDRVDELNGWPVGRRRGSAKVQIGAELLCKSVTHALRERDRGRAR
jgi:hypothetical protein